MWNCVIVYNTALTPKCCFKTPCFLEHVDTITDDKILLFAQCDNLPNKLFCWCHCFHSSYSLKTNACTFSLIFHLQFNDIIDWDSSTVQTAKALPFSLTKHKQELMTTSLICFCINFEHQSPVINLTRFINRKNSSSTETSQAPDQEKGPSSGPKMHYWVKRIDEKKIQL